MGPGSLKVALLNVCVGHPGSVLMDFGDISGACFGTIFEGGLLMLPGMTWGLIDMRVVKI